MFMRYTYMLEFVGTIALIFMLFSNTGFSATWNSTNIANPNATSFLALGDSNNNGLIDISVGLSDSVKMYENASGGWITTGVSTYPLGDGTYGIDAMAVGDANNNGLNDIVAGAGAGGLGKDVLRMYENISGGWVATNLTTPDYTIWTVTIGDADNDGKNEIVYGTGIVAGHSLFMYKNVSGGWVKTNISTMPDDVYSVKIGDANNDGLNEIVAGLVSYGAGSRTLRMYENTSGGWQETNISSARSVGADYQVAIGDANNDGLNEIISALISVSAKPLRVYYNISAVWYEQNVSVSTNQELFGVAVGDADNDGSIDIVTGANGATANPLRIYRNSSGSWVEQNVSSVANIYNLEIGDVLNNGNNSIVIAIGISAGYEVRSYDYVQPAPATPSTWLKVDYNSPSNLTILSGETAYFNSTVSSSDSFVNCSLRINSTAYGNTSAVSNNSAVSWAVSLGSGNYSFNMSCYAGSMYNSTENKVLSVIPDFNIVIATHEYLYLFADVPIADNTSNYPSYFGVAVIGSESVYNCSFNVNGTPHYRGISNDSQHYYWNDLNAYYNPNTGIYFDNGSYVWNVSCSSFGTYRSSANYYFDLGVPNITAVPEWLQVGYVSPLNMTQTANNTLVFSILPISSESITGCRLSIGMSEFGNVTGVVNNSAVSWTLMLVNGSYPFNMSCDSLTIYNSTGNFVLDMAVPNITAPPAEPPITGFGVSESHTILQAILMLGGLLMALIGLALIISEPTLGSIVISFFLAFLGILLIVIGMGAIG